MPIGTALLIEYLAPVLLVLLAWARTRRAPRGVVIAGTLAAVGGLVLVIGPDGIVRAVIAKAKPATHDDEVLSLLS